MKIIFQLLNSNRHLAWEQTETAVATRGLARRKVANVETPHWQNESVLCHHALSQTVLIPVYSLHES